MVKNANKSKRKTPGNHTWWWYRWWRFFRLFSDAVSTTAWNEMWKWLWLV